jgi:hypothetical protein
MFMVVTKRNGQIQYQKFFSTYEEMEDAVAEFVEHENGRCEAYDDNGDLIVAVEVQK